jgi:uroporphyrinogen decarboxylase
LNKIKNDRFLRACLRQEVDRTPIWIMRQAGRYLPDYRKVRAKTDFLTLCKTPELATEVTLQPIDIIGVDAAIIFSDILVIPEAMGMKLEIEEGRGPVFENRIKSINDFNKLNRNNPTSKLKYVMDALRLTKNELKNQVPLIGFSGSPFTLLTYMVEGKGTKTFSKIKGLIYSKPEEAHKMLSVLSDVIAEYLSEKIEAGADALQLFDTWGGILSKKEYLEFSLPYMEKIISQIKREKEPVIVFSKGAFHSISEMAKSGADVLGLDWTMDIGEIRKKVGKKVALQGNLDPTVLYAPGDVIRQKASEVLESFGEGNGHIFNLGHGILPDINPENAKLLVKFVKTQSKKYHK